MSFQTVEEWPTRKRQRVAKSNDKSDESKKHRGRPRVERSDETAADRRRTQIRLAQRAYRQRKETTISSLQKQVSQLRSTIGEMSKTFLEFNDHALSSGILRLQPELARELRRTAEKFMLLGRCAVHSGSESAGSDEEGAGDQDIVVERQDTQDAEHEPETASRLIEQLQPVTSADAEQTVEAAETGVDIGWGYQRFCYSSDLPLQQQQQQQQPSTRPTPHSDMPVVTNGFAFDSSIADHGTPLHFFRNTSGPSPSTHDLRQYRVTLTSPPDSLSDYTTSLPLSNPAALPLTTTSSTEPRSPYTYSFQETTFARRLQRAALERGFHLLSHPHPNPAVVQGVFKVCLQHSTPAEIHAKFRSVLLRSTQESLEFWQTPFIHLGGAGTHYPRRSAGSDAVQQTSSAGHPFTERSYGPFRPARAASAENEETQADLYSEVDLKGFEGEWFDAQDVEGYLEEKGVRIDPQASFAEAEIVAPASETAVTSNSSETVSNASELAGGESVPEASPPVTLAVLDVENYHWRQENDAALPMDFQGVDSMTFQGSGFDLASLLGANRGTGFVHSNRFVDSAAVKASELGSVPRRGRASPVRLERQTVTIDVTKLLEELIKRAVCLGRAPGFRRKDVDFAFNAAMIRAY